MVVPHILVGLYKGQIRGEYRAVEFLAREGVDRVVFIVFMPTPEQGGSVCLRLMSVKCCASWLGHGLPIHG